jgi:hypothetical protein
VCLVLIVLCCCCNLQVVAGFAENQQYGLGTNSMTGEQKSLLIYGVLALFFILFLGGAWGTDAVGPGGLGKAVVRGAQAQAVQSDSAAAMHYRVWRGGEGQQSVHLGHRFVSRLRGRAAGHNPRVAVRGRLWRGLPPLFHPVLSTPCARRFNSVRLHAQSPR